MMTDVTWIRDLAKIFFIIAVSKNMMSSPLVSILLPVRNGGHYLQHAVESLLEQSFRDFELILVDDNSTDGAISALPFRDKRIRVFHNTGRGIVQALNTGAENAQGEFLARMDADDICLPHRLLSQLDYLEQNPHVGIAGGLVEMFSEKGDADEGYRVYEKWINALKTPEDISREIFIESPIPHPTAMFRKSVFNNCHGYRESNWAEDYDFWLRMHEKGIKMGKPDSVILKWRDHQGRLSRIDRRYAIENFLDAKAFYLSRFIGKNSQLVIWGSGETGRSLYDKLEKNDLIANAFIDIHPRRVGGTKRGKPVCPPEELEKYRSAFLLVAVGTRGARAEIRNYLETCNWQEGKEYLCVA